VREDQEFSKIYFTMAAHIGMKKWRKRWRVGTGKTCFSKCCRCKRKVVLPKFGSNCVRKAA